MVNPSKSIALLLACLLIATLPFSIALNSVLLGLMTVWIIVVMITQPAFRNNFNTRSVEMIWAIVPLCYAISILYSNDYNRAFQQWLNFLPLLILPVFFTAFGLSNHYKTLSNVFVVAICILLLIHLFQAFGLISLPGKESGFSSLFYDAEKHSFIIWSGILLICWHHPSSRFWNWILLVLMLGLLYFSQLSLIFLALFTHLILTVRNPENSQGLVMARMLIFGTGALVFALVFFAHFRIELSGALYNFVALYTNEQWTTSLALYLQDIHFSFLQWIKHPFTGVGLGDYAHAMWNEYNDHGLRAPGYPRIQIMHLLVSTGILGFLMMHTLINGWIKLSGKQMTYLILVLLTFVLTAPLKSQISATALMLAVLLIPVKHESE